MCRHAALQGYVFAAAVVITALSPPFGKLLGRQQQLSGEYRQLHSRVRSHCESIALYGGHSKESSIVSQAFSSLTRHTAGEGHGVNYTSPKLYKSYTCKYGKFGLNALA